MRKLPNNSLDILARTLHKEIRIFYENPKNIEKFNNRKKKNELDSLTGL